MEQNNGSRSVTVGHVVAEVMKREGIDVLLTYPLNPLTERCAEVDIRPIVVRQERIGVHMADAIGRLTSADKVGVFACQEGPGIENAFGAVAQCWSEGVPLVVFPSGGGSFIKPAFNATMNFQHITKHSEIVTRDFAGDPGAASRLRDGAQWPSGSGAHRIRRRRQPRLRHAGADRGIAGGIHAAEARAHRAESG